MIREPAPTNNDTPELALGRKALSGHNPYLWRLRMTNSTLNLHFLPAALCLIMFGVPRGVSAAEQNPGGSDERLLRLEQRVNELAERQEQWMRRLSGPQQYQGPMPQNAPMAQPGPALQPGIQPQPGGIGPVPQPGLIPQPGRMLPPPREHALQGLGELLHVLILVAIVCNILLAVWIYTDIRKRGEGSGIFVAVALVAGIPAAIIYSLVRVGDKMPVAGK